MFTEISAGNPNHDANSFKFKWKSQLFTNTFAVKFTKKSAGKPNHDAILFRTKTLSSLRSYVIFLNLVPTEKVCIIKGI